MIFYSRLSMKAVFTIAFSNILEKSLLMLGLYKEYAAIKESVLQDNFTDYYNDYYDDYVNNPDKKDRRYHYRNAGYQYVKPILKKNGYRTGKQITWRMMHKTSLLTPVIVSDQLPILVKCIIDAVNGDADMRDLFFMTLAEQCNHYTRDTRQEYDDCSYNILKYHYTLLIEYTKLNNRNKGRAEKVISEIEDYLCSITFKDLDSITFKDLCRKHKPAQ